MLVNLVNAVNKLMVQHAVDVTNLQNNIKQLENKITTNKEGEICQKLEKKNENDILNVKAELKSLKSLQQKHSDDIEAVKKTHSEDMKKLQGFLFLFPEKFKFNYFQNYQTKTPIRFILSVQVQVLQHPFVSVK